MEQRIEYTKVAPGVYQAMQALGKYLSQSGLEPGLQDLVKLRASQINGCAYCIDMHWKDARAAGESEMRLYALDAWRESPFYTESEQAALEWTEALTLIATTHAPDDSFARVRAQFDEKQLASLTWAIAAINAWNRIAIAFRATPGQYAPPRTHAAAT